MTSLTDELAGLPHVAPPPDLAKAVLTRIERIENAPRPAALAGKRDWSIGMILGGSVAAGAAIRFAEPVGLLAMETPLAGGLVLVSGLVLYAAGLLGPVFAPPRSR